MSRNYLAVLVAALGYFVDVFDLWLFANFRVASLQSFNLNPDEVTRTGAYLINCQQIGLLLGGFLWGVLGDKCGRIKVMFGSILMYSVANILNAYVDDITHYAILRFLSGLGLAGEIGVGITLVSELLSKEGRGYGTTIVATIGVAGAIAAAFVAKVLEWRTGFLVGGIMGLMLLLLRVAVHESGMFATMKAEEGITRGSLTMLFHPWSRFFRFVCCVLVGIPIYFVFGIIFTFSPEISIAMGLEHPVSVPDAMLCGSIGMTVGDLVSGLLSQRLRRRKLPIVLFMSLALSLTITVWSGIVTDRTAYYVSLTGLGLGVGYWACVITMAAEQFGTNLRATVTTIVPNLVRGSAILFNLFFIQYKAFYSLSTVVLILAVWTFVISFLAIYYLKETYGKDLNYYER